MNSKEQWRELDEERLPAGVAPYRPTAEELAGAMAGLSERVNEKILKEIMRNRHEPSV